MEPWWRIRPHARDDRLRLRRTTVPATLSAMHLPTTASVSELLASRLRV
jgi:hypothetical protein